MRTEGKSYQMIARTLGISKSAAHKWGQEPIQEIAHTNALEKQSK